MSIRKTGVAILALQLSSSICAQTAGAGRNADEGLLFESLAPVMAASRFEQPMEEAPSSISIITAEDIRRHGWRTLDEILDNVRGFSVTQDRNYSTLGMRGFARGGDYNSRILLLLDGLRVNANIYGESDYGRGGIIDTALIDRVEVIRGPSSSIHGAGAFFGVINVITQRGRDLEGTRISAGGGSFHASELGATTGRRLDTGLEYLMSASGFGTRGVGSLYYPEFDTPANGNGIARNADGERARRFFGKLRRGDFSLAAALVQRDKAVPTAAYGTVFGDTRFRTRDERMLFDLRYDTRVSDATELHLRTSWNSMYYGGAYPIDYPPVALNNDRAYGRWMTMDALVNSQLSASHRLTSGIEYQFNSRIEQSNYDLAPRLADSRRNAQGGAFLQDEWRIAPHAILSLGVRRDHYPTFGGTTNPRAGLVLRLRSDTVLKALAGRAYRAPNAYELYYTDGASQAGNPNLRPETIASRELVLEHAAHSRLHFTGSVYRNRIGNFIQQVTDPVSGWLVFQNIGGLTTHGWEVEARWQGMGGAAFRTAYSRQATQDAITGARVAGSPAWTSKLDASLPFADHRVSAAAAMRVISRRPTLAGNTIPASAVADVNLRYAPQAMPGTTLSAGLLNAFDKRYADPGGVEHTQDSIAQNGRTWRLQLEHAFQ